MVGFVSYSKMLRSTPQAGNSNPASQPYKVTRLARVTKGDVDIPLDPIAKSNPTATAISKATDNLRDQLNQLQSVVSLPEADAIRDDELSKRDIVLDEGGYYTILVDKRKGLIVCEHYSNTINETGKEPR